MAQKYGKKLNLINIPAIEDTDPNSTYFVITEFSSVFTGGKNCIGLNGSNLLKVGSSIQIEVLDVNGNPLYTEVARSANQVNYREGVSIFVAIYVYQETPVGLGKIIIVGQRADGQYVRWQRNININSSLPNSTRVRFYKQPVLTVNPVQSDIVSYINATTVINTGTVHSIANIPTINTNYLFFDALRNKVDYRLIVSSGDYFSSFMENSIIYLTIGSQSFQSTVEEVISKDTLRISDPFTVPGQDGQPIVSTFTGATYSIEYVPYLNAENLANPSGSQNIFKQSLAEISLTNLQTFSGNPYRFRLYRKSLNSNPDSECIADELLTARELFVDETNANRTAENIGYFYTQSHIDSYWFSSFNQVVPTHNSDFFIDSMYITGSGTNMPNENFEKRYYIIAKDNTTNPRDAVYVPYTQSQNLVRSGSAYDSNFLTFYKDVEYVVSLNAYGRKENRAAHGRIDFYLTGSECSYEVSPEYDGYGIKILTLDIPSTLFDLNFGNVEASFSFNKDVSCTMVINPYYGEYFISKVSIKPYQAFSYSPEIINIRVPFPVEVNNQRFQIKAELFDANHNLIPVELDTFQFFDPSGSTLPKFSSSVFATVDWINITSRPGWIDNYPIFNDAVTFTNTVSVTGTLSSTHVANLTASYALQAKSASYVSSAQTAVSASYSAFAQNSTSASYALTASSAQYSSIWSNLNLLKLGTYYFWVSGSGASATMRMKSGIPTSESDGKPVV